MTQFRVLPIRRGDAYLLASARGDYLVDGGRVGCELPELLADRRVRKLRAAICTSACAERLGGILELMEEGCNVREYWLPEELERITEAARRFNGDRELWQRLACGEEVDDVQACTGKAGEMLPSKDRRLQGVAMLISLGMAACFRDNAMAPVPDAGQISPTQDLTVYFAKALSILSNSAAARWRERKAPMSRIIRDMGWQLFNGGGPAEMAVLCGRLLLAEAERLPGGDERGRQALVQGLAMAAMTAALIARAKVTVRSFRHTGRLRPKLVPRHPMICLNGHPCDPLEGLPAVTTPQQLMKLARRISGHRNGLVFQYGDPDCGALFCSDTRLTFLEKEERVILDRPTIITAPRQGTMASERAYNFIHSSEPDKDIWVRSHYSNARKISVYYKNQPKKECLNNCRDLTLQEILIEFSNGKWNCLAGGGCVCGAR